MKVMIIIAATAALAACGSADPVDNSDLASALPAPENNASTPSGGPPSNAVAAGADEMAGGRQDEAAGSKQIPEALQGRWGLAPGDCTSTRGDSKGLLVVSSDGLKFYESRAVPLAGLQTSPDSADGEFGFTGEGQQWTRHISLELRDSKLIRTERDPLTSYTYVRC